VGSPRFRGAIRGAWHGSRLVGWTGGHGTVAQQGSFRMEQAQLSELRSGAPRRASRCVPLRCSGGVPAREVLELAGSEWIARGCSGGFHAAPGRCVVSPIGWRPRGWCRHRRAPRAACEAAHPS
jgi:hypothetical protein